MVFPIYVLVFSYFGFNFNSKLFATHSKYLVAGTFDDSAIIFADPSQVSLFKSGFDTLRHFSIIQAIMRLVQNVIFTARIRTFVGDAKKIIENPMVIQLQLKNQRRLPKWAGAMYLLYGCVVVISVCTVIHRAEQNCAPYPGCQGFAYVLTTNNTCPCIFMVDREMELKRLADWDTIEDVTEDVRRVAAPGRLRALSLINRKLTEFPTELATCGKLQDL